MSYSGPVKGAVLLLGSLYWEGNEPAQDGKKGRRRKEWRDDHLEMKTCRDFPVPIRYGRRSSSRNGEFTIVLGGQAGGLAKIADLKCALRIENDAFVKGTEKLLREDVIALAEAEGIWNDENNKHFADWGLVSIGINPRSTCKDALRQLWAREFRPGGAFDSSKYGKDILDKDGILAIAFPEDCWKDLDFWLATLTKPDDTGPTPEEIAAAVNLGSYFRRTRDSGIKTPDDERILTHLKKVGS